MGTEGFKRTLKDILWQPQEGPQTWLLECPVFEVFFGGARGGGKTDGMLGDWIQHEAMYGKHASGVFFRRQFKQLEMVIARSKVLFPALGASWNESSGTWTFKSGATLKMRHLWDVKDADNYQGHEYTWICFEELGNWPTPAPYDLLRGTLRSAHGVDVQLRSTGNPGGAGHAWLKARFIDPAPEGMKILTDPRSGLQRTFIPSKLEDNKILTGSNPMYEKILLSTGADHLVKAWRWGQWDIVAGGYFEDVWVPDKHVLKPFSVPPSWKRRRSFDWGSSSPSSLGFWAEANGSDQPEGVDIWFPKGSLIRTGEWYTVQKDANGLPKPNKGLRLDNSEMGRIIAEKSKGIAWKNCVADPSIFVGAGGKSQLQQLQEGATKAGHSLRFQAADNARVAGWQTMRTMLKESAKDIAESRGLWIFENNRDWLRTVPLLQTDTKDGDDVDTDMEDHAGDETRYICHTRTQTATTMQIGGT